MEESRQHGANLFRIFGVQIAIDYSWLIMFLLVLWSLSRGYFPGEYPGYGWWHYSLAGLAATLLFFASLVVHELSHAVVANRLGETVRRITLFIFGGMAHLSGEPRNAAAEFKIAAVGPLTSTVLGVLFWGVSVGLVHLGIEPLWTAVFRYLGFVNLALAIFNLLPGFPLDGGRLLRAFFWRQSGNLRDATRRAADWGGGIAIGLMLLGALQIFSGALIGGLWLIFIGMFLRGAARASYYGVVVDQALGQTRVRDLMVREPVVVSPNASVSDAVEDHFLHHGFGGFPVGAGGQVEGLISLPMVQRCPRAERATRKVREIMRPLADEITISPDAAAAEALHRMLATDLGRLLVIENGRLAGLISRSAIVRFVQGKTQLESSA